MGAGERARAEEARARAAEQERKARRSPAAALIELEGDGDALDVVANLIEQLEESQRGRAAAEAAGRDARELAGELERWAHGAAGGVGGYR